MTIETTNHLDARLMKGFALWESGGISLNFEVFNVFNSITNTSVNTGRRVAAHIRI